MREYKKHIDDQVIGIIVDIKRTRERIDDRHNNHTHTGQGVDEPCRVW